MSHVAEDSDEESDEETMLLLEKADLKDSTAFLKNTTETFSKSIPVSPTLPNSADFVYSITSDVIPLSSSFSHYTLVRFLVHTHTLPHPPVMKNLKFHFYSYLD